MNEPSTVTVTAVPDRLDALELPPHEVLEGSPHAGLRFTAKSADDEAAAGFWSCEVGRYEFVFDYDEFVYLIRGEIVITEAGSNRTLVLRAGESAHFPQGTTSIWQVTQPVLKYFVARRPY
ncbi:MAG TPA: cupin domain-containing protein [Kofleriaceae bacterium]|nr:cupin domain-containing protein [Kofleriaceae bacterium]